MNLLRKQLKNIPFLPILASIKITVTCLMLLFILTFWGTVAQVENGLYVAQSRFFHSWIFLIGGFFPFPGAQSVLWVLFINLSSAVITRFVVRWNYLGILIIHSGLLLYFVAAYVTFQSTVESNVSLHEGEGTNLSSAYHDWELSFWKQPGDQRTVTAVDTNGLKSGEVISLNKPRVDITIEDYHLNSQAYTVSTEPTGSPTQNASGIQSLKPLAQNKEPEKNIPGGVFRFSVAGKDTARVLLFGGETTPSQIHIGQDNYFIQLRRKRFSLPFVLELKDFKMETHPNTQVARSYQSLVEIKTKDLTREVLISMNKPLRYKDFTLYQASYAIDGMGREISTLAVVKNFGRLLPYIASLTTFAGLVIHFLTMAFNQKFQKTRVNLS